jgi:hypothetical protein
LRVIQKIDLINNYHISIIMETNTMETNTMETNTMETNTMETNTMETNTMEKQNVIKLIKGLCAIRLKYETKSN